MEEGRRFPKRRIVRFVLRIIGYIRRYLLMFLGYIRRYLLMFFTGTVAALLLLVVNGRRVFSTMGVLFMRDQVTRMASVELWVVLTTLLLVVRFLLDFFGPWYANRSMTRIVLTIEMLNYSMVHYTIGQMQLSSTRANEYFQVWAVLLVTLQYSVKIGRPYNRSKQIPLLDLMSSFWTANLLRVKTFFLLRIPLWLIWALNAARIISYFFSTDKANRINEESNRFVADYMSYEHRLSSPQLPADAGTNMELYKYVIYGEDQLLGKLPEDDKKEHPRGRRRVIEFDPKDYDNLITVEKIWNVGGDERRLLGGTAGQMNQLSETPQTSKGLLSFLKNFWENGFLAFAACHPGQLKDVCLSFALYKLLRRRFYDLPVHEARLPTPKEKIRRLVFKYILQNEERAFRVAAIELSFLQDLFYSKHAAMFANGFPTSNMVLSLLLVAAVGYITYPVRYIPERLDQGDHNRITHGVFITRVIIFLIAFKELAEIYIYVFSQWTKVLMLCSYVKHQCMRHWPVEMVMRVVLCFMNRGTWKEKIRQHNLLISTRGVKIAIGARGAALLHLVSKFPKGMKLEDHTKKAIFNSLKELGTKLEKLKEDLEKKEEPELEKKLEIELAKFDFYFSSASGNPSLQSQFQRAFEFEADTHKILVWHIATCLCEIKHASKKEKKLRKFSLAPRPFVERPDAAMWWENYITAVSLSNYCMYLVTESLVPDNGIVAKNVFMEVRREINHVTLDGSIKSLLMLTSMKDVYDSLMKLVDMPDDDEQTPALEKPDEEAAMTAESQEKSPKKGGDHLEISKSLTRKGAKLAKELTDTFGENKERLWEQLAEFWTGYLLYLAAFTRASKHRARLAGSRELATHLWALLSHAGFLGGTAHGHTFLDREVQEIINPLS